MPDKNAKLRIFIILGILLSTTSAVRAFQDWEGALKPENFNEARLNKLQPPDKVMDAIGLKPGMIAAEIGAGRGRYVMHLAHRVGKSGKVYAEDIDAEALRHLEQRCARWGIENVETILGEVMNPKLPEGSLDLIFIISSYHHFDDPVELLRKARPSLKPTGVLAIGEWLPRDEDSEEATTPKAMEAQMKDAGYRLDRTETFLKDNRLYIYIFRLE
ncbi:MAG: class I SAM-dependent methyltransferase [Candidatus Aminicenantes bacterium]|nr:class I SAM-dependent methyltransferase [Candidatus Aminicenantes bacterium]